MGAILFSISNDVLTPQHGALECVKHRGDHCDGKNFSAGDFQVSLGCRHYLFTDLTEHGRQPISYEDGDCWAIMDGEIYNHQEIRRMLVSEGYSFKSESDVEVALAAYSRWGAKCLKYFQGMFSLCIYHQVKQRFFLARDPFGIKPLYFVNRFRNFTAVSEIKQLLSFPWFQPEIQPPMIYHYLVTGTVRHDSLTMWKDVFELPPGHYVEQQMHGWAPGCPLQAHCWYKFDFSVDDTLPLEDTAEEFRSRLEYSVQSQIRHQYPLGIRVTGDLNTAAVSGIAASLKNNERLKLFSLYGEGDFADNFKTVSQVARFIQAEPCGTEFKSRDFLFELDRMIYANDFPLDFNRSLLNWMIYSHGICNRRIILDGEGASQFLFSSIDYYWALLNRKMFNESAAAFISDLRRFKWVSNHPWLQIFGKLRRMTFGRGATLAQNLIVKDRLCNVDWPEPNFGYPEMETDSLLKIAIMEIMRHRETLHFLDRCAFYGQCEIRHPFMDQKLTALALRLPLPFRLANGLTKQILRVSCANFIPRGMTDKSDLTDDEFVTEAKWQKRIFHTLLLQNIDDILREYYIDKDQMAQAVHKYTTTQMPFPLVLWRLIVINRWKKVFNLN